MRMNAVSVTLMPATRKITLRMTVRSWRRNAKPRRCRSPPCAPRPRRRASMALRGMRTTVTMSTAETANAAPDTNNHRLDAEQAEQQVAQHRAHEARKARLIWLTMAVARTMPSRGTMNGTAACTVGWYTLCAAYRR